MVADDLQLSNHNFMPIVGQIPGGWTDAVIPLGYMHDGTTNVDDLNYRTICLLMLNWLIINSIGRFTGPVIDSVSISGSGVYQPPKPCSAFQLDLSSPVPPEINKWFGSPNIYKFGQFSRAYFDPPAPSKLDFFNFSTMCILAEDQTVPMTGLLYNLEPGVSFDLIALGTCGSDPTSDFLTAVNDFGIWKYGPAAGVLEWPNQPNSNG